MLLRVDCGQVNTSGNLIRSRSGFVDMQSGFWKPGNCACLSSTGYLVGAAGL